ncbi:hypothetical protein Y032_0364g3557 [Ancylostoma ceylanicum]|nr:hypothetical protein Y032_0364g3557 [Ancylostoma ceylanicum]
MDSFRLASSQQGFYLQFLRSFRRSRKSVRVSGCTSGLNRLLRTMSDFSICSNPCIIPGDFNLLTSQGNLSESTNISQTFLNLILTHRFQQQKCTDWCIYRW